MSNCRAEVADLAERGAASPRERVGQRAEDASITPLRHARLRASLAAIPRERRMPCLEFAKAFHDRPKGLREVPKLG